MQASFATLNSQPERGLTRTVAPHPPGGIVQLGELFCGAGGMALGASRASHNGWRFQHAWVTDKDKDSCRTIQQVVPASNIETTDIKDLNFCSLQKRYGQIDGLVFGFPCNDFSAGDARIDGEYGGCTSSC